MRLKSLICKNKNHRASRRIENIKVRKLRNKLERAESRDFEKWLKGDIVLFREMGSLDETYLLSSPDEMITVKYGVTREVIEDHGREIRECVIERLYKVYAMRLLDKYVFHRSEKKEDSGNG